MSSMITQIISFAAKDAATAVNFRALADAARVGTKGLQSQMLGSAVDEPETKQWFLGMFHYFIFTFFAHILYMKQTGTQTQNPDAPISNLSSPPSSPPPQSKSSPWNSPNLQTRLSRPP